MCVQCASDVCVWNRKESNKFLLHYRNISFLCLSTYEYVLPTYIRYICYSIRQFVGLVNALLEKCKQMFEKSQTFYALKYQKRI